MLPFTVLLKSENDIIQCDNEMKSFIFFCLVEDQEDHGNSQTNLKNTKKIVWS